MNKVLELSKKDRKALFILSAEKMMVDPIIIEKDFWVVFVLHHLFASEISNKLVFKGGTSLSKCYDVIKRFSEDIDIAINRADLGCDITYEELAQKSSNFKQKFLKNIQATSKEFVGTTMLNILNESFASNLKESFKLCVDDNDDKKETLKFFYPSLFDNNLSYISQYIKLECGARGDGTPSNLKLINTYLSDYYLEFKENITPIPTLSPNRTFWEKTTLLHAEFYRPSGSNPQSGISRHYYDIYMLSNHGYLEEALQNIQILKNVICNKDLMFPCSWYNYKKISKKGINLLPIQHRKADLISDYQKMQVMFFTESPSFDQIMIRIAEVERVINEKVTSI